ANTFTGAITVNNGGLYYYTINNFSGGPSSLGNPSSGAITLGNGSTAGLLGFIGVGINNTSDRTFTLSGTGGGVIQTNLGTSGTLTLTGNITNGTSPLTFHVDGTSTILESGIIGNGSGTVTMEGESALTLSGANT